MNWKKLGLVFNATPNGKKLLSHAANPLPIHLSNNIFRVFYSGRDADNASSVGFVDIDVEALEVVKVSDDPLIENGLEGTFFSHGISIGNCYLGKEGERYVLFMGWQIPSGKHWRGDIGRLQLSDDLSQIKLSPQDVFLGTDEEDEISLSYPFVLFHNNQYKMWYGSTISWNSPNGEMIHVIKYATSPDGEHWEKHGVAIPYELGEAQAFSRPWVIVDENGKFHMWYSYRSGSGEKYRIGYASSDNGVNWLRKHAEVGIDVSEEGWDSEMICYPALFNHNGKTYLLYNGNSHGKDGFGLAVLEGDFN